MSKLFNENSRVKIPAILYLTRLNIDVGKKIPIMIFSVLKRYIAQK